MILRRVHLAHSTERPMTNAVSVVRSLARDMLCDLARTGRWSGASLVELAPCNRRPRAETHSKAAWITIK